jgi:hypothetical protein
VREQVERLEHHADLAADALDVPDVVGELDPVDDDPTAVVALQTVDRADEGGLARTRRPDDHDDLAVPDRGRDPLEGLELAEPLLHVLGHDHGLAVRRRVHRVVVLRRLHRSPTPSRVSTRWLHRDIENAITQNRNAPGSSASA